MTNKIHIIFLIKLAIHLHLQYHEHYETINPEMMQYYFIFFVQFCMNYKFS